MAGINKNFDYLKVLSWDLNDLFEDSKVDKSVTFSMHSNRKFKCGRIWDFPPVYW